MQEDAEALKESLMKDFGKYIQFAYIDVQSEEVKNYPKIAAILKRVNLPLTVINDEPRFHGGISNDMISEAVREIRTHRP
ncbi:MAG: hypothetical protein A4E53_02524 [Pelotomaculum sp. PtaB.Bin104]|nr:MAG: hypothetical protein A4E53_02524 [Pelotomaculum sp. PtaB.Bin104]